MQSNVLSTSSTEDKLIEYAFIEWNIENFNFAEDLSFCIRSATFRLAAPAESSWCLGLEWNPSSAKNRSEATARVYLVRLLHSDDRKIFGRCRFGYTDRLNTVEYNRKGFTGVFSKKHIIYENTNLNLYQSDTSFKIVCEIVLCRDKHSLKQNKTDSSLHELIKNMNTLRADVESHDAMFQIKRTKFTAHKFIVGARCSFFNEGFAKRDSLKLADWTDPETLQQLLHYCYTGDLDFILNDISVSFELREFAHTYDMPDLLKLLTRKEIFLETKPTRSGQSEFVWKIENFSQLKNSDRVSSPVMAGNHSDSIKWQLMLFKTNDNIGIYFRLLDGCPPMDVSVKISIEDDEGEEDCETEYSFQYKPKHTVGSVINLDFDDFMDNFLVDDTLTIICRMIYTNLNFRSRLLRQVQLSIIDSTYPTISEKLSGFMTGLLKNKDFCDITIKAGGRKFKAHKELLKKRSPYFAEILKGPYKKSAINLEVTADVMDVMLNFMYSGRLNTSDSKIVHQVYKASLTYSVNCLKEASCKILYPEVCMQNFEAILRSTDPAQSDLKEVAQNYMLQNPETILAAIDYHNLESTDKNLYDKAMDIVNKLN